MILKNLNPFVIFNILLIITFSVSVNTFVEIQNINLIFYTIFHLIFIYFLFYYYHFTHYLLGFIYGILFDIFLLNDIGSHLITLIILISIFIFFKKFLFLLSSNQVFLVIFIILNITIYFEIFLSYVLNNIYFTLPYLFKYFIISMIIFIPSIFLLNKIDR